MRTGVVFPIGRFGLALSVMSIAKFIQHFETVFKLAFQLPSLSSGAVIAQVLSGAVTLACYLLGGRVHPRMFPVSTAYQQRSFWQFSEFQGYAYWD
ncbi:hypothetical protein ElyMa_006811200 [Elysia marginata]|uniref:Uncharacterized protein n=1 Tax=Elysia marginata TaxID=1093978 RepID=A0AAV4J2F7_9GAST|nr:hypothetical protein ElyMa_006811200 [Elysia marginata]